MNTTMHCPYNPNLPAPEGMYFGLDVELTRVLRGTTAPIAIPLLIVGGRRIGKTSFLWEIERRADRLGEADSISRAVYLDLASVDRPEPKPMDMFHGIARAVSYKLVGDSERAGLLQDYAEDRGGFHRLVDLVTILADQKGVRRVVIMLDELELLRKTDWLPSVLRNFSSIVVDRERGNRLGLIGTSSRKDLEVAITDVNVAVARFETIALRALTKPESEELIRIPLAKQNGHLPVSIQDRIWQETGGHPYLVHWLMKELFDLNLARLESASEETVGESIRRFHRQTTYFTDLYLSSFRTLGRDLYQMSIDSPQGISMQEIKSRLVVPGVDIDLALDSLEQSGVVRRVDDMYVSNGQMFKTWFSAQTEYRQPAKKGKGSSESESAD